MQLVIEISSYDKAWITNGYYIPEEINMRISEAIINGIEIPEGHGKIGDIDALEDLCYRHEISNSAIDGAPIISKKQNEEGDNVWEQLFRKHNLR